MIERKPYKKRRDPSDYPQYAFRLSKSDKEWLEAELKRLHIKFNHGRNEKSETAVTRNTIILEALKIGFAALKKQP